MPWPLRNWALIRIRLFFFCVFSRLSQTQLHCDVNLIFSHDCRSVLAVCPLTCLPLWFPVQIWWSLAHRLHLIWLETRRGTGAGYQMRRHRGDLLVFRSSRTAGSSQLLWVSPSHNTQLLVSISLMLYSGPLSDWLISSSFLPSLPDLSTHS